MLYAKLKAYADMTAQSPTIQFLQQCKELKNIQKEPKQFLRFYYTYRDMIASSDEFESDRIRVAFIKKAGELFNPVKVQHLSVGISELYCAAVAAHEEISTQYGQVADFYNDITVIDEVIRNINRGTERFAGYQHACPDPTDPRPRALRPAM